MKQEKRLQEVFKKELLDLIGPGDTIYTIVKHVSKSGMYRVISLVVIKDNIPLVIDSLAAPLLYGYDSKHKGCKVKGTGMDMGFNLVYELSYRLFNSPNALQHRLLS